MTDNNENNERHVVFGTGPVGLAVADELVKKGKRVRVINRSGKAQVAGGGRGGGGRRADPNFTREASAGAAVVYNALNPPYDKWPELFPPHAGSGDRGRCRGGR